MKKNEPLVSIVIANYNGEKFIEQCMDSLLSQTYKNIEIIVCDDNSKDNSVSILSKYDDIKILKNSTNLGAATARNKCIEESMGEYILIQDMDDYSANNRIERLLETIVTNNLDFVSSGMAFFNDEGIFSKSIPKKRFPTNKDFLFTIPYMHATTMFKKTTLDSVNGYRIAKETKRGQDYDLFMRLHAKGFRGENINDLLYFYRVDDIALKRRKYKYRIHESIIRYKGFKKLKLLPLGLPFVIKPLVVGLIPQKTLNTIKNFSKKPI